MEKNIKIPVQPQQGDRVRFIRNRILGQICRKWWKCSRESNRQEAIFEHLQSQEHSVWDRYYENGEPWKYCQTSRYLPDHE